jgi:hypothetical protein
MSLVLKERSNSDEAVSSFVSIYQAQQGLLSHFPQTAIKVIENWLLAL